MSKAAKPRSVVFVLYDGVQLLDVAGAAEVFALAGQLTGQPAYELSFVSTHGMVTSSAGLPLGGVPLDAAPSTIHTLVIPGAIEAPLRAALRDRALQRDFARDPVSWAAHTYLSMETMSIAG